ncbi:hypothetical protein BSL78_16098 [Apostichopus japonicus]|uniref:TNFR-Cys domain-containing protein n=1 Tax=Stichopus japonicus TaxID=307972 RepID=A0A2G8KGE0_STIJA|nr:hypothetical protein BSL78_16098 [Apostichopus japonicus]
MAKLDITMEVLLYVSAILLICAGTLAPPDLHDSYMQDRSVKNFGCKFGESRLHVENGPNCPCGNYAVDCHKKDTYKQDIEQRKPPFWRRDGKLQFYYCQPCSMCGKHLSVLAKCSSYNDTQCGSKCEDPYQNTNAGCFMRSSNISNVNDATYTTETNEQIRKDNTTHPPPNTIPKEPICISPESFNIFAAAMVAAVLLVVIVLVGYCFDVCKQKRAQPTPV